MQLFATSGVFEYIYMPAHDLRAKNNAEEPSNAEILREIQKVNERVGKIETALYGTGNPHGVCLEKLRLWKPRLTAWKRR